jgi:hypothetical protein
VVCFRSWFGIGSDLRLSGGECLGLGVFRLLT